MYTVPVCVPEKKECIRAVKVVLTLCFVHGMHESFHISWRFTFSNEFVFRMFHILKYI